MVESKQGGCQCGAVRYRVDGKPVALSVCHCTECQRQSGSAFGMSLLVREDGFQLLSGELKTFTRAADSGRTVDCAFCSNCGTRIYHDPSSLRGIINIKPGTLDDRSWLVPALHAWTKSRQAWVAIPEDVRSFVGQP